MQQEGGQPGVDPVGYREAEAIAEMDITWYIMAAALTDRNQSNPTRQLQC
jgi:hypothetical protein